MKRFFLKTPGPFFIFLFFVPLIFSCSLKYEQKQIVDDKVPELYFTNAKFTRYKGGNPSFRLEASELEQYRDNQSSYAKDAFFTTWKDMKIDAQGNCGFLNLDTGNEIYTLFNDINIKSNDQDFEIHANNIKWNGITQQLTSSAAETVTISHGGMTMEGGGFAASGLSRSFTFDYAVSGTYTDNKEEEQ